MHYISLWQILCIFDSVSIPLHKGSGWLIMSSHDPQADQRCRWKKNQRHQVGVLEAEDLPGGLLVFLKSWGCLVYRRCLSPGPAWEVTKHHSKYRSGSGGHTQNKSKHIQIYKEIYIFIKNQFTNGNVQPWELQQHHGELTEQWNKVLLV